MVAVVGFAFFLVWELTEKHPVVDLSLFKRRNFWTGAVALAIAYGLFFGNIVLLPLWLQQYMGYTATQAGMAMAPVGLLAIVLSPIVGMTVAQGRSAALRDLRRSWCLRWCCGCARTSTPSADFTTIMIPTIVQGIAMAFFFIPLVTITLSGLHAGPHSGGVGPVELPADHRAVPSARRSSTTLWDSRATLHHAQLVESVNNSNQAAASAISGLGASGYGTEQVLGQLNRMVDQQAFMLATADIFYASAVLFLFLIPLVWLAKPTHGGAGASDAAAGAH